MKITSIFYEDKIEIDEAHTLYASSDLKKQFEDTYKEMKKEKKKKDDTDKEKMEIKEESFFNFVLI